MLEMWAVRRCLLLTPDRARLIIHHIAGSSNLLQNVFFISICVGGFRTINTYCVLWDDNGCFNRTKASLSCYRSWRDSQSRVITVLLGGTDSKSRASETTIVLNLVTVNFPYVPVQLCLMNIQTDTPHTSEGFFVWFFFGTLERLLSFFF